MVVSKIELKQGDILYIPVGWFHHFVHDGEYVNVVTSFLSNQHEQKINKVSSELNLNINDKSDVFYIKSNL